MKLKLLAPILLTTILQAQQITKVVFTWSYDYTAIPACDNITTSNCITRFDLTEGTTPIVSIAATTITAYTFTLTPLPSSGMHNYNLVAVELLTGTSTIASDPAIVSVQIPSPPGTPANFKVSTKNRKRSKT